MGVLLPRTQINSMLRDVTWRDVTQHFLHAVPWLNYYETFGLYGLDVVYLTVAEQFYLLKKKRIKRPPLKVKKCLSNKTWVPLGPSTLAHFSKKFLEKIKSIFKFTMQINFQLNFSIIFTGKIKSILKLAMLGMNFASQKP